MTSTTKRMAMASVLVGAVAAAFAAGVSTARQPAMRNALENLREAKANLQNATSDKGGHRVEAIRLTDLAIAQVLAGIEAGADD